MTTRGFKQLMAEANASIDTMSVVDAKKLQNDSNVAFIDVREKHEREEKGFIAGSSHTPRGFLEMIVAEDGPMHDEVFASGKRLVLYCGTGGRSALAAKTLNDMGINHVSSMAGGFAAWAESGGPTVK